MGEPTQPASPDCGSDSPEDVSNRRSGKPKPWDDSVWDRAMKRRDIERPAVQIDISRPESITTEPHREAHEWQFFDMDVLESFIDRAKYEDSDHTMSLSGYRNEICMLNPPYIDGRRLMQDWELGHYKVVGWVNSGFI